MEDSREVNRRGMGQINHSNVGLSWAEYVQLGGEAGRRGRWGRKHCLFSARAGSAAAPIGCWTCRIGIAAFDVTVLGGLPGKRSELAYRNEIGCSWEMPGCQGS